MHALREIVKVKNHEIKISLPEYFNENEELEVIVLPKEEKKKVKKNDLVSLDDVFGIWKDRDISLTNLRHEAWGIK